MHTCYSPVRRSPSGGVATSHAAPRLACVKPVASVHPEPGSNSSLCISVLFFSLCKRTPQRRASRSADSNASLVTPRRGTRRAGLFTCHFGILTGDPRNLGILTGDPRNPFLVSHLLVRFPHRKHVNDLRLPDHRTLSAGRQKNRSTRNGSS